MIDKIKKIINGRPCFVVAKGASIKELEEKIEEYKDLDVCWVTLNDFHYIEETILDKIGKKFELVSDCATVANVEYYENNIRIPRFEEYLSRDNNLLMLSELVIQQCFKDQNREDLLEKYKDKIITIDELFSTPGVHKDVWLPPPNSITLLYAFLIAGGANTVIIFGLDGYQKGISPINSYYRSEVVKKERMDAYQDYRDGSLGSDGVDFNNRWNKIFDMYKTGFNNSDVKFYNCSQISTITAIPKINYEQVKGILNEY